MGGPLRGPVSHLFSLLTVDGTWNGKLLKDARRFGLAPMKLSTGLSTLECFGLCYIIDRSPVFPKHELVKYLITNSKQRKTTPLHDEVFKLFSSQVRIDRINSRESIYSDPEIVELYEATMKTCSSKRKRRAS
jgi:hypothetical protein